MPQFEILDTKVRVTADNERQAETVRQKMKEKNVFLASYLPPSGKQDFNPDACDFWIILFFQNWLD